MKPLVQTATESEAARAIDVIVLAFAADPTVRWTWPDPHVFLEHFPRFVKVFGGDAFLHSSAYRVEGFLGAALWLPPGIQPDEVALTTLVESTVPKERLGDVFGLLEQMGRYHPTEPHWYLPLIGVDPAQQGKGYGAALMQRALAVCDRDHKPAYLESTNPRNVPLYQRHGFEVLGTIQAGRSPQLVPMLRKPN